MPVTQPVAACCPPGPTVVGSLGWHASLHAVKSSTALTTRHTLHRHATQEFQDYGVTDPDQKHLLYYKIKDLRQTLCLSGEPGQGVSTSGRQAGQPSALAAAGGTPQQHVVGNPSDLLDLEEHDGDLLPVGARGRAGYWAGEVVVGAAVRPMHG